MFIKNQKSSNSLDRAVRSASIPVCVSAVAVIHAVLAPGLTMVSGKLLKTIVVMSPIVAACARTRAADVNTSGSGWWARGLAEGDGLVAEGL